MTLETLSMPAWVLLVLLFIAWVLWLFACLAEVALSETIKGIPEGERRGVSILPVIPIFPLVFWGMALFIDLFFKPWGTIAMAAFHMVLSLFWLFSGLRDARKLKKIEDIT